MACDSQSKGHDTMDWCHAFFCGMTMGIGEKTNAVTLRPIVTVSVK